MLAIIITRCATAGLLGISWAYVLFAPGDPFDRDDFNDDFSDKIDRQLEDQGR